MRTYSNDAKQLKWRQPLRPVKKVLLICTDDCDEFANISENQSFNLAIVHDGEQAVERVERESFDATVILSTGKNMDPLETALNLRDINQAMDVLVLRTALAMKREHEGLFPSINWCSPAEIRSFLNLEGQL
jgi:PleD family two-component response regulator